MRDEGNTESHGGGGDPSVGVMGAICTGVARLGACDAEADVRVDQIWARIDDLRLADPSLELAKPEGTPSSSSSAVAQLGDGLEGDEHRPAAQDRLVEVGQLGPRHEIGAEYTGVDHDGTGRSRRAAHSAMAARKARPSSSSTPSMSMSACGGRGRARLSNSSTGSSRCSSSWALWSPWVDISSQGTRACARGNLRIFRLTSEGSPGDVVEVGGDVGVLAGDDVLVAESRGRGGVAESGHDRSQGSAGGGGEGGPGVSQVVKAESFEADLLDRRVPDHRFRRPRPAELQIVSGSPLPV